jgi:flagellar basal body-associated protein FliL
MPSRIDPEYTPLSQSKRKRPNYVFIGVITLFVLVLAGGAGAAVVWYTASHKAAENAALVSKSPLIFLKLYKLSSQVLVLSDQEKQSFCIGFYIRCWSPIAPHNLGKLMV